MKMKFKLIALLLVFVMVLPFVVACGSDITLENTPAQDKNPVAGELTPIPDAVDKADLSAEILAELLEQTKLVNREKITVKGKYKGTISSSLLTPTPENIFSSTEWVDLDMNVLNALIGGDVSAELKDILIGMVLGGEYEDGDELLAGLMNSVDLDKIVDKFGSVDMYIAAKVASHYFRAVLTAALYDQFDGEIPTELLDAIDAKADQVSGFVEAYLTGEADFETFFDFFTMDHPMSDAIDQIKSTWNGAGNINLEVYLEAFKPYIPSIYSEIVGDITPSDGAIEAIIESFEDVDGAFANGDFFGVINTFYAAAFAEILTDNVLASFYSEASNIAYNITCDEWVIVFPDGTLDADYIDFNETVIEVVNTKGYFIGSDPFTVYDTFEEACAAREAVCDDYYYECCCDIYQLCEAIIGHDKDIISYADASREIYSVFYDFTLDAALNGYNNEEPTILPLVLGYAYMYASSVNEDIPYSFVSGYMSILFGSYMTDNAEDVIGTISEIMDVEEIYFDAMYNHIFGEIDTDMYGSDAEKIFTSLGAALTNFNLSMVLDSMYFDSCFGVSIGIGEMINELCAGGTVASLYSPLAAYLIAKHAADHGFNLYDVYYAITEDYAADYISFEEIIGFIYAIDRDAKEGTDGEYFEAAIELGDAKVYVATELFVASIMPALLVKAEAALIEHDIPHSEEDIAARAEFYAHFVKYMMYSVHEVPWIESLEEYDVTPAEFNYELSKSLYILLFDADLSGTEYQLIEDTYEYAQQAYEQSYMAGLEAGAGATETIDYAEQPADFDAPWNKFAYIAGYNANVTGDNNPIDDYSLADFYNYFLIPTLLDDDAEGEAKVLAYHLLYLILEPNNDEGLDTQILVYEAFEIARAIKNVYYQKFDDDGDMSEVIFAIGQFILDRYPEDSAIGKFASNLISVCFDFSNTGDDLYELILKQFYGEDNEYANAVIDLIGTGSPELFRANLELLFSVAAPEQMGVVDVIMSFLLGDVDGFETSLKDIAPDHCDIYVDVIVAILNNDAEALIAALETITNIDAADVFPGALTILVHYFAGFGDINEDIITIVEAYTIYGITLNELDTLFGEIYPNFEATMDVIIKHLNAEVFDPVTFALDVMVSEGVFDGIAIPEVTDEYYYEELISTIAAINVFMGEGLSFYDAKNCANVTVLVLSDPDNLSAYAGRLLGAQKTLKAAGSDMWKIFAIVSTKAHLDLADDSSVNWEDVLGYLTEAMPGLEIQNYDAFAHILRGSVSTAITSANTDIELVYDNALETVYEYTMVVSVIIEDVVTCSLEIVLDVAVSKV